jgi:hypothetical protein
MSFDINQLRIGVVGLGYVGLPLAVEFGRIYPTVGFDIDAARVAELESGSDSTLETTDEDLASATHLAYSTDVQALKECNFYRRHRRLRVDRLPGRYRGILRADSRAGFGPGDERGFLRRLQPRTHQPGRH